MSARLRAALVILGLLACACGEDTNPAAPDPQARTTFKLPDGTQISAPAGATYYYQHVEVFGSSTTAILLDPEGDNELVVARIDWHFCNPNLAKLEFFDFAMPVYGAAWRIPTRVTTPLAGISVLGVFAGSGTLEGGMRVDLDTGVTDTGANRLTITDGCQGDWVTLYGYRN